MELLRKGQKADLRLSQVANSLELGPNQATRSGGARQLGRHRVPPEVLFGASSGTQQRRGWFPPAAARRPQLPRAIQLPSRHEGENRGPDTAERHTKSGLVARGSSGPATAHPGYIAAYGLHHRPYRGLR